MTPNIDRLAAQGMKFMSHHHCQNCTPTRAALMSGQYGARTGLYTVGGIGRFDWSSRSLRPVDNFTELPLDRDIIAKQLKAGGYVTGMFGKWHIGEHGAFHPGKRGFDEAIVSAGVHFGFNTDPKTNYPKGQYLADNTLLIFTSDNGGVGGYGGPDGLIREPGKEGKGDDEDGGGITDNAPLRSGKGSLYEGGTREPFIVRWPGVAKPGSACEIPTAHVDIFPTFLELGSAPKPRQVLDGESLVKLFRDPAAKLQRDAIFQHFPGYLGMGDGSWRTTPVSLIQMGDWKLMEYLEDGKLELYNLRDDIGETKNLATDMPDKAKELHARLVAWRKEVNAPMPTKNDGKASEKPKKKGKGKGKKNVE